MKILICHLSDIHLRHNKDNPIMSRIDKIKDVIRSNSVECNTCFIVLSGDIAFSGNKAEYEIALNLICNLQCLKKPDGIFENLYFITVPGNHDCNFEYNDVVRDIVLRDISIKKNVEKKDEDIITKCVSIQKDYFNFLETINERIFGDKIHSYIEFNVNSKKILFHCLNTAWMSQKSECQGSLIFPNNFLNKTDSENYDIVITVFHHPYNWLESNNKTEFRKIVQEMSDIIITGHEHIAEHSINITMNKYSNEYYAAGVLQDEYDMNNSEFGIILLDLSNCKEEYISYYWSNNIYNPDTSKIIKRNFIRNKYIDSKIMKFNNNFEIKLNDVGAKLEHPFKDNLVIDDIYIYPNLSVIESDKKDHIIKSPNTRDYILKKKRVLITGDSSSGKSTLARVLCKEYLNNGIISILIDSYEFRKTSTDEILSIIYRKFVELYSPNFLEEYKQYPKEKKAIILDDFHTINLNSNGREQLLKVLFEIFDSIIIFANDTLRIDHIVSRTTSINFLDYANCIILEFGYFLRNKLIKKWYTLGREYNYSDTELNSKCIEVERRIDVIVGKNFLPSYPIYLLMILQQLELTSNLNTNLSSYGYLYQSLINNSLISIDSNSSSIDINDTYLTEFAYYMFINKKRRLNEDDIKNVTNIYNTDYSQTLSQESIIYKFLDAGILAGNIEECNFKYKYIYYYYVAKYITNKIDIEEIKDQISNMSKKLYNEEYANIMIFLCHLSKNPFIIDELLLNAMVIYDKCIPCDFDNHISFVKSMYDKIPQVKLSQTAADENRENLLHLRDEYEMEKKDTDSEYMDDNIEDEDNNPFNELLLINKAFKTIQILGQILKNYPGSIIGKTKYDIAMQCHLLGMRTLNFFLTLTDENIDSLLDDLVTLELKNNNDIDSINPEKIREKAKMFIFKIVEILSLGFIKKVAESIANDKLKETYKEVVSKNNHTSFALVNLSIKMDCLNIFPYDEIIQLADKLEREKNLFSLNILKHIVSSYFYLYNCSDYRKKQSVCSKLKISYKDSSVANVCSSTMKKLF